MSQGTQKFVKGTLILSVAGLIAKLLSAFFRVPLANMIGDVGMGYYGYGYPIYTLCTSIAIIGIPSTIAKLVAEKRVVGAYKEAREIFNHTMKLMLIVGVFMSCLLGFGAPLMMEVFKWEAPTIYSLWGICLSPFFICIMGTYRGYFQGMQNMLPTAISQVVENFARVIVGLSLAYMLMPNIGMAAGGASFGAVAGGVFGSATLMFLYYRAKPSLEQEMLLDTSYKEGSLSFGKVAKTVLWIAVPISIGAAVNSVMNFMDSAIVTARLVSIGVNEVEATAAFGQLTKVATFINLPLTFGMAIVAGLVPAISEAVAKKDQKEVQSKIELGSRFALLISLPASVGLAVLAQPIMNFIYPGAPGGAVILAVGAFSIAFVMLAQAFTGILQGMGSVWTPVKALALATVVKALLNFWLVGTSLHVVGASVASIISYAVFAIYNYIVIQKKTNFKLDYGLVLVKPIIASGIMGAAAWVAYFLGSKVIKGDSFLHNGILTLGAVGVGAIVYVVVLWITGGVSKQDIEELRGKKEK